MMAAANGNGSVMGSERQKVIAMGNKMVAAQWTKQLAVDNHQRMRGQIWEQCLIFGWSVCCEIWTGLSKNIQIHMSTYIGNA
jgi:hypothetical protein